MIKGNLQIRRLLCDINRDTRRFDCDLERREQSARDTSIKTRQKFLGGTSRQPYTEIASALIHRYTAFQNRNQIAMKSPAR